MLDSSSWEIDRLLHIRAEAVQAISISNTHTLSEVLKEPMRYRALRYCFLVMGEAANILRKSQHKDIPIQEWDKLVSIRHRIAHAYDSIDDEILYNVAQTYLGKLVQSVEVVLQKAGVDPNSGEDISPIEEPQP